MDSKTGNEGKRIGGIGFTALLIVLLIGIFGKSVPVFANTISDSDVVSVTATVPDPFAAALGGVGTLFSGFPVNITLLPAFPSQVTAPTSSVLITKEATTTAPGVGNSSLINGVVASTSVGSFKLSTSTKGSIKNTKRRPKKKSATTSASITVTQAGVNPVNVLSADARSSNAVIIELVGTSGLNVFSSGSDPSFNIYLPPRAISARVSYDNDPRGVPSTEYVAQLTQKTFENISPGTWYLHVQIKTVDGWEPVTTQQFIVSSGTYISQGIPFMQTLSTLKKMTDYIFNKTATNSLSASVNNVGIFDSVWNAIVSWLGFK